MIVIERSQEMIPCKAIGSPMPGINWYAADDQTPLLDDKKYTIYQNGSLQIRSIEQPDALKYTCAARNLVGEAKRETTLKIACKCLAVKTFKEFILWVVSCNKSIWKFHLLFI